LQVGLGLPIDGSRDHEIKIKDFPDVQVGNWRDWQPKEAREGEDIQSNLTLEEVEKISRERNRGGRLVKYRGKRGYFEEGVYIYLIYSSIRSEFDYAFGLNIT
jgi:hypothetical protein